MKVWTLILVFAAHSQSQHAMQTGLVKEQLTDLEIAVFAVNEGKKLEDARSYNSDPTPVIKLTPKTQISNSGENISSNFSDDKTLMQRLMLEEEESRLVAGLHLEKKIETERSQNSPVYSQNVRPFPLHSTPDPAAPVSVSVITSLSFPEDPVSQELHRSMQNSTLEVNKKQVKEDDKNNKTYIKEMGTSQAQTDTGITGRKTGIKSKGNGIHFQPDDKTALIKTEVKNVSLKSNLKTRKTEKKSNNTQKEPFPYFTDNYCPPECACYGRVVQCSDKGVDRVPYGIPYNSRYILLMNNRIDRIQLHLLSEYGAMEFLALTNNRLTDGAIEGAFEGIPALKRLYLDKNRLRSVPGDLPATLEELRLDNNRVGDVSEAEWAHCPGLLILSMRNNSLGNGSNLFPGAALSPLSKLQTLNLDYNQLTSVPLGLPLSIKQMYLKGNQIEEFRSGAFNGKSDLLVLDLSHNRLTNPGIFKHSLVNATQLESLNLEGNRLKHTPPCLPPSLKTLNLEGNLITRIKKSSFAVLVNLEHLSLARNKIVRVVTGTFKTLPVLHQLDLGHNALRQVPRQLPKSLHSVSLSHNRIQVVPRDAFCWGGTSLSLSGLVRVQLQSNFIDLGNIDTQAFRCLRGFQVVHFH